MNKKFNANLLLLITCWLTREGNTYSKEHLIGRKMKKCLPLPLK